MRPAVIVMGASSGGVSALRFILLRLRPDFPIPLVVVLHRDEQADTMLAHILGKDSTLPVVEAEDKQVIEPGHLYLAPAGYHTLLERGQISLSVDPPVLYARPSIDVLFESAAYAYRSQVAGILLTGASADGAQGLRKISQRGGLTIVQDPKDAQAPAMPIAAIQALTPSRVAPLAGIVRLLNSMIPSTQEP